MKKLILIVALFSIAIMANATEKKEILTNTSHENEIVKGDSHEVIVNNLKVIKTKDIKTTSESEMLFGCGSEANGWYNIYRGQGFSHREARALRRVWVRKCRGNGPGGWLNLPVQF